jgi:hypothetical protein
MFHVRFMPVVVTLCTIVPRAPLQVFRRESLGRPVRTVTVWPNGTGLKTPSLHSFKARKQINYYRVHIT